MTLKHLPLLYEYWVLLSIHEILCEELGFQCDQTGPGLNPELHSGYKLQSQGQLQYQGPDGASARLIYQGLFRSLDDPDRDDSDEDPGSEKLDEVLQSETARQVPDGLLCLDLASCDSTLRIILDAKYRLEPDGGPRNSDINTMHRYRDAILLRNEQNEWLHAITQAWFIYPGSPDESLSTKKGLDRQKKYLQSAKSIGIGAIPALPGHREELAINLQRVLNSSRAQLESSRPRTTHRQSIPLPARQPQCLLVFFDQENELNSQFHQGLIQLEDNSLELSNNLAFVLLCLRQNPINQESYYSAHSLHEARLLPKPHKPSIRLGHSIEIEGSSIFRDQAPEKFQVQPFSRVLRNLGKALK